jgi:hypothetical protein
MPQNDQRVAPFDLLRVSVHILQSEAVDIRRNSGALMFNSS